MDQNELWKTVLGELEVVLSKANYTTWFRNTFILEITDNNIVIGVPHIFAKEWLENKFQTAILEAVKKVQPKIDSLSCKVCAQNTPRVVDFQQSSKPVKEKLSTDSVDKSEPAIEQSTLNKNFRFDNFVVGPANRLAAATAEAVINKPGAVYNPLFLYGGVGLGKTHLAQAIGREILVKFPKKNIVYITSEKFTNDFISSVQGGKIKDFKKSYRGCDVLIVDDIQFLSGKEGTQEEFFHTFNSLHQENKQIIMTSDRIPQAIPQLTQRLISRFGSGMVADIQPPNLETREAILRQKCKEKNFNLDDDIIHYIAKNIESNIRELEGAINRVKSSLELSGEPPSLDNVSRYLEDLISAKGKSLTVEKIVKIVGEFFKIESKDLLSEKRNHELVWPRQIVMYLLRHEMNLPFPRISQELKKKDHSTIIHGVKKIEKEIGVNSDLQKELTIIKEKLYIA